MYSAPGLKVTVPIPDGTNVHLSLLEADPGGTYDIYFATNINADAWSNVLQGTSGQTNFTLAVPQAPEGFFRASRSDQPVTNAGNISVYFTNEFVSTNVITAFVDGGPAASMAILINNTNFENANWMPFSGFPLVTISTNEGVSDVWFGFQGSDGITYWSAVSLTLDTTPPSIIITNPVATTTSRPIIQLQGYSMEPLSGLTYDLSNASVSVTNESGFVTGQASHTNGYLLTTNWFQCFDIELANGTNMIILRVTDLAGNTTTTNLSYTMDVSGDTNSPAITLAWPQHGSHVSGTNFTVRGVVDDETALLTALIVQTNGTTNIVAGVVERSGDFWIEEVPLGEGTNSLTLTATDAAGNSTITNILVARSDVAITIDPVSDDEVNQSRITISGTISDANYTVWVNGVQATVIADGSWTANQVPVFGNGTAIFDATAIPPGGQFPVIQSQTREKPAMIYVYMHTDGWGEQFPSTGAQRTFTKDYTAQVDDNGHILYHGNLTANGTDGGAGYSWWSESYEWSDGNPVGTTIFSRGLIGYPAWDESGTNSGWGEHMHLGNSVPSTSPQQWDPFIGISHYYANVIYDWGLNEHVYSRRSKTFMKIRTGGKSGVPVKNLFTINANATRYGRPVAIEWGNAPDEWVGTQMASIAPDTIRILGRWLGADGKLHIVLPDNTELDLGANAPGRHYALNAFVTKHKLRIQANGYLLAPERVRPLANYCVGQYLEFVPVFTPSVLEIVNKTAQWEFDGIYVNDSWQLADWSVPEAPAFYGSVNFSNNPAWLALEATRAWWVSGAFDPPAKYHAHVGERLTFENGQEAVVTAKGLFSMHRPKTNSITIYEPFYCTNIIASWFGVPRLLLSLGDDAAGAMLFAVTAKSRVRGVFNVTQLINMDRTTGPDLGIFYNVTTEGRYDLDNDEWIDTDAIIGPSPPGSQQFVDGMQTVNDSPAYECRGSVCTIHDEFRDYLRFKPDGDERNIWITIGRVDWAWNSSASVPTNTYGWQIDTCNISLPKLYEDSSFPMWTKTVYNTGKMR